MLQRVRRNDDIQAFIGDGFGCSHHMDPCVSSGFPGFRIYFDTCFFRSFQHSKQIAATAAEICNFIRRPDRGLEKRNRFLSRYICVLVLPGKITGIVILTHGQSMYGYKYNRRAN